MIFPEWVLSEIKTVFLKVCDGWEAGRIGCECKVWRKIKWQKVRKNFKNIKTLFFRDTEKKKKNKVSPLSFSEKNLHSAEKKEKFRTYEDTGKRNPEDLSFT